jgi:hypothetical protein
MTTDKSHRRYPMIRVESASSHVAPRVSCNSGSASPGRSSREKRSWAENRRPEETPRRSPLCHVDEGQNSVDALHSLVGNAGTISLGLRGRCLSQLLIETNGSYQPCSLSFWLARRTHSSLWWGEIPSQVE